MTLCKANQTTPQRSALCTLPRGQTRTSVSKREKQALSHVARNAYFTYYR